MGGFNGNKRRGWLSRRYHAIVAIFTSSGQGTAERQWPGRSEVLSPHGPAGPPPWTSFCRLLL